MKQTWNQLVKRLDALSERERVLIFLAGAALVLAVAYLAGIEPGLRQRRLLSARMVDQQAQLVAADAQKQALARQLAQDPDAAIRERIADRQHELAELDGRLSGLQRSLISPERMSVVLEQLIGPEQGVRLVSLRNLPAAPLMEKKEGAATAAEKASGQHVYKHGVEVVVEGSYSSLLAYVARLERQPWQVYWGKTVLSADYPKVVVSLTLYTLSLDRSWLVV